MAAWHLSSARLPPARCSLAKPSTAPSPGTLPSVKPWENSTNKAKRWTSPNRNTIRKLMPAWITVIPMTATIMALPRRWCSPFHKCCTTLARWQARCVQKVPASPSSRPTCWSASTPSLTIPPSRWCRCKPGSKWSTPPKSSLRRSLRLVPSPASVMTKGPPHSLT